MKKLIALMFAAMFALSFVACGDDEEEAGNACEQLADKMMDSYDGYCADHADCELVCNPDDQGGEGEGEVAEPTDEELDACQAALDNYSTYEESLYAGYDAICAM